MGAQHGIDRELLLARQGTHARASWATQKTAALAELRASGDFDRVVTEASGAGAKETEMRTALTAFVLVLLLASAATAQADKRRRTATRRAGCSARPRPATASPLTAMPWDGRPGPPSVRMGSPRFAIAWAGRRARARRPPCRAARAAICSTT